MNPLGRTRDPRGDWYSETVTRATTVLPKLITLDISHNKLTAGSINHESGHLPAGLVKLDLSSNPLGLSTSLIRALSRLTKLTEICCEHAAISDDSFPASLFPSGSAPFPSLRVLDLGETQVTRPAIEASFLPRTIKQTMEFEVTTDAPGPGVLRVIVGKRVIKEAWEIEAENRTKTRGRYVQKNSDEWNGPFGGNTSRPKKEVVNEPWEAEVALTEGAKRRARAATATASSTTDSVPSSSSKRTPSPTKAVEKEAWEIEAEQGLLTAGGRRRARAAALAAAAQPSAPSTSSSPPSQSPSASPTPSSSSTLSSPQYYTAATRTLTLPPSAAVQKSQHFRSFSLAIKIPPSSSSSDLALAIPTPTLPLTAILAQPFANTLKILVLTTRKMDSSFSLPADSDGPFLPALEELVLEGCNLGNSVPVSRSIEPGGTDTRTTEPLLPLLAKLFPSVRTLDLSYNALTSSAFTSDALTNLILGSEPSEDGQTPRRHGLRHLRLRGNRLTELDGFQEIAEMFKGNRDVKEWKLEELDLRDNEIGRLPPEAGLLPLDVFLVDGNV